MADRSNCGACGNTCGADQSCTAGQCVAVVCPAGAIDCNGTCVNPTSDKNNCGACGNVCAGNALGVCLSSVCRTACSLGNPSLGVNGYGLSCNGACVDATRDVNNCGNCGAACGPGQSCNMGQCVACQGGTTACGGSCANLTSDANNCGACGQVCAPGNTCSNGSCQAAAPSCSNNTYCANGACSTCPSLPNAVGGCVGNACGLVTCVPGFADCDAVQSNGCETSLTDVNNCGACGRACGAGQTCSSGTCVAMPTIASFTAQKTTVTVGTPATLLPVFTGGSGVITDSGGGTYVVASGSLLQLPVPPGTTTYTLTVTGLAGQVVSSTLTVTAVPSPSIASFLSAAGFSQATGYYYVTAGQSTTLTAMFANGVGTISWPTASGVSGGSVPVSSSVPLTVGPYAVSQPVLVGYTLTVTNAAGDSAVQTLAVLFSN
jgi:hypothetical protein